MKINVSIPQGTIKRVAVPASRTILAPFQFHKVRLKDSGVDSGDVRLILFQFHKVRLKENDIVNEPPRHEGFNSTRYD